MALTLTELKKMLVISKHRLDDELELQAQVQFDISESLGIANAKQSRLENEMEEFDAKLLISLRKGDVKRTVAELQAEIIISGDHQSWLDDLHIAKHQAAQWHGMYEAWKQRGFALKALADLSMSNYFAVDTTYEKNRGAIAESKLQRKTIDRHRRI
jgi:hypothetical protein